MSNTLIDDLFAPYVDALDNYNIRYGEYFAASRAAEDILRKVENRQRAEQAKFISQIADLENEEKRLKLSIRQRVLKGQNSDEDITAGARIAVISEQKAAFQELSGKCRRMTDEEKERWEQATSVLYDAESNFNFAIAERQKLTARLQAYVRSIELWGATVPVRNSDSLFDKAYKLNSDGGFEDEQEA